MRLSRNKQKPVFVFKMVDAKSDYVGTEKKIDLVGCFDCVVEEVSASKTDGEKTEKEVICKLTIPTGYHFKTGFMCSLNSREKPDMKIVTVKKFTNHCVCECVSWT